MRRYHSSARDTKIQHKRESKTSVHSTMFEFATVAFNCRYQRRIVASTEAIIESECSTPGRTLRRYRSHVHSHPHHQRYKFCHPTSLPVHQSTANQKNQHNSKGGKANARHVQIFAARRLYSATTVSVPPPSLVVFAAPPPPPPPPPAFESFLSYRTS